MMLPSKYEILTFMRTHQSYSAPLLPLIGFIAIILWLWTRNSTVKRHDKPLRHAPDALPLLGNGLVLLGSRNELFSWFVKCERRFGFETIAASLPFLPPVVIVSDPKNLEFILKNETIFAKGSFFRQRSWDLLGNGIINSDGELWKTQRRVGMKFLNKANMKVLTDIALPKYLNQAIQTLESSANLVVDVNYIFHEITTQLMGRMAFDMEIHNSHPFSVAFDLASGVTEDRFKNPFWKITELFTGRPFREACAEIKSFGSLIVSNIMQQRKSGSSSNLQTDNCFGSTSGTLINALIDEIKDERIIVDSVLSFLSAAKDTTGQALTWTLYLLIKNPTQMKTARDHIDRVVSESKLSSDKTESLDTSIFQPSTLPYIAAVVYESLRLYPPVPMEIKQCQKPTLLPDGTYVPKYGIVLWCIWAINRSKLIWGEDADLFRPERWIVNEAFKPRSAFEFPVFNAGPRICVGKNMAENIIVQVIAATIHRFDFQLLDNSERVCASSITLPMKGGFPCRVMARK